MRDSSVTVWVGLLVIVGMAFCAVQCGGSGAGEFDKIKAERAIMDGIKSDRTLFLKTVAKAVDYNGKEPPSSPQTYTAVCKGSEGNKEDFARLAEQGLIKLHPDPQTGCLYVSFLDKATPFIKKQDNAMRVVLAEVDKIEVTDLGTGKQARSVSYKIRYTPTPFGQVLLKTAGLEEERRAGFTLSFDEGWRLD